MKPRIKHLTLYSLTFGLALGILAPAQAEKPASGGASKKTAATQDSGAKTQPVGPYKDFKGVIKTDIRDSKADWGAVHAEESPRGRAEHPVRPL